MRCSYDQKYSMNPEDIAHLITEDPDVYNDALEAGANEKLAIITQHLTDKTSYKVEYLKIFDYIDVCEPDVMGKAYIDSAEGFTIWVSGGDRANQLDMADPNFFNKLADELRDAIKRAQEDQAELGTSPINIK